MVTAFLAARTPLADSKWSPAPAVIIVPKATVELNAPVKLSVDMQGASLDLARVVWEARDQEPAFGRAYTVVPRNSGRQWAEVEIEWPDGRRAFASGAFEADSASVNWVEGALPAGAVPGSGGGDAWTWTAAGTASHSGRPTHQSSLSQGLHEHMFNGASATLKVDAGDTLFAWVYLDPDHVPAEIMLSWNDGGSWEHRAYWGANTITYGRDGSPGRFHAGPLPPAGRWVCLRVRSASVGLGGASLSGMGFSLVDGRATWDSAGRSR